MGANNSVEQQEPSFDPSLGTPGSGGFLPPRWYTKYNENDKIDQNVFCAEFDHLLYADKVFNYLADGAVSLTSTALDRALGHLNSMTDREVISRLDRCGFQASMLLSVINQRTVKFEYELIDRLLDFFPTVIAEFHGSILAAVKHSIVAEAPEVESNLHTDHLGILEMLCGVSFSSCHQIFSSRSDGFSYKRLAASIRFYPGGLLFLMQDDRNRLFGFYGEREEWTETGGTYDTCATGCVIFQIEPEIRIRRAKTKGSANLVFFNSSNPNHPHGIGLGGQLCMFRFLLNGDDLSDVSSVDVDASYEPGNVLSSISESASLIHSRVAHIEVFGFQGNAGTAAQQIQRDKVDKLKESLRRVDRARLVETEFDREMFLPKTFSSNTRNRGTDS